MPKDFKTGAFSADFVPGNGQANPGTQEEDIEPVRTFGRYLRSMFIILIISSIGYYLYLQKGESEIVSAKYLMLELQVFSNKIGTVGK